jgi:hypothetical protein
MKKFLVCTATIATLHLNALYQSNPSLPQIIDKGFFLPEDLLLGIRAGYQHDQVFNRNLKAGKGADGDISKVYQLYDQGVATFNFWDRAEIFGSLGAMSIFVNDRQRIKSSHVQVEIQSKYQFTWGAGLRAAIINWKDTNLGVSGSFQYASPHVEWNTIEGASAPKAEKFRYAEWQVGAALSQTIDLFIPYIGVNYSKVDASIHGLKFDETVVALRFPSKFKMRSRHHFGMVLGCDFSTQKYFDLGVEVQLISEQAITLKADIRF